MLLNGDTLIIVPMPQIELPLKAMLALGNFSYKHTGTQTVIRPEPGVTASLVSLFILKRSGHLYKMLRLGICNKTLRKILLILPRT